MTSTGFKSPWQGVWSLDVIVNRRIRRPRTTGVTMIIDTGLGATALRDILGAGGRAYRPLEVRLRHLSLDAAGDSRGEAGSAPMSATS